ncbi:hypothetical protein FJZ17_04185 [Candidatus Pacearchaeota archaeon]|nr:hypothetical protein [Candidatus Pacearchaeota archaeon]
MKKELSLILMFFIFVLIFSFVSSENFIPKPPPSPTNYGGLNDNASSDLGYPSDTNTISTTDLGSSEDLEGDGSFSKALVSQIKYYLLGLVVVAVVVAIIFAIKNGRKK